MTSTFTPLKMHYEETTKKWLVLVDDPHDPLNSFIVLHRGAQEDCYSIQEFANEIIQKNLAVWLGENGLGREDDNSSL